jgi:hypothetical protein
MKLYFALFCLVILFSSCFRTPAGMANAKEIIVLQQNTDSLAVLNEAIADKINLDSIRISDSIAAVPPPVNYDTVFVAGIQRTPCFGKCPQYEIRLYKSGLAEYIGMGAVEKIGKYQCRLDSSIVALVIEKANDYGFFDLNDFYPVNTPQITDFPMCVSSVRKDGELKIVYNRNDAPLNLIKFQNFLDQFFSDKEWRPSQQNTQSETGKGLLPDRN